MVVLYFFERAQTPTFATENNEQITANSKLVISYLLFAVICSLFSVLGVIWENRP